MAQAPQNVWNNSWGSQTNRESTPPAGWSWDFGKNYWEYTGVIPPTPTTPTNTTIYQTSSIDCFPDVIVNTTGDPVNPPTGDPVHIPGISPGKTTPTPPAPPANPGVQPVPTFGKFYNVCFDDGLLNQKGWTRPRFEGSKLRALYYNEYTDEMDEGKELGPIQNPNIDTSIDGLQFVLTSSFDVSLTNTYKIGNPFEKLTDNGIVTILHGVTQRSCQWQSEFKDYAGREQYPPKSCGPTGGTTAAGTDQTYQKANKSLPYPPFGPKIYDVPLVPTSFYKINPYTQEPEKIERKQSTFDLIPTHIKLNPIDPKGLNGGPFFLGTDPGQNEQVAGNDRLSSEYQLRYEEREYVHQGPFSYVDIDGTSVSGVAQLNLDSTWGYNQTFVSRSAIIPERESDGDLTYGKTPVIENYSNAVFFGNTVYGYQQSDVFPGPGPDFSYLKLEKAYVFNSTDDSFFVQEIKSEGEDRTFQNLMQSTFPWATDFRMKLLDYDHENNLKSSYGIHWNRGYFSEIASYTTESAHYTSSGHYPGTGRNFQLNGGSYLSSTGHGHIDTSTNGQPAMYPHGNSDELNEGAQFRKAPVDDDDGGYFYLASDNGGGEGGFFYGGFKRAGMDFGRNELDFPKHQEKNFQGSFNAGPGLSNFFGLDPLPGGMRYYRFRFWPVHRPVGGMSADSSNTKMLGRVLSGTFTINDKNPSADWWFSKGGERDIKWVSESCAGDVTSSMKMFMDECHKQDDLYILTFNEAKNVDKSFNQGFHREDHPYLERRDGNVPGYPGTPSLNYTDATLGDPANVGSYSYYINYVRPLNTFGSMLYSNTPEKVGIKNAHNLLAGMGDAAEIGMGWYDYSEPAVSWSLANPINPDTGNAWTKNDTNRPDYHGIMSGYGPMGGLYASGINAPRFLNGSPFVEVGDTDGEQFINDGNGGQSDPNGTGGTNGSWVYNTAAVWTAYMYGNNYRHFYTGTKYIDFRERKGWPGLNKWTISKLEEKPNFILADINKEEELPQGVGQKGFILIPDTLNPRIKANLDYYLSKAGLIDKEKAPKYKDRSIKKGTYLPPRIKLKRRKRRGWFWKLKKRIKGKDY